MKELLPIADGPAVRRYAVSLGRKHPRQLWLAVFLHVLAAIAGLAAPRLIGDLVQDVATGTTVSTGGQDGRGDRRLPAGPDRADAVRPLPLLRPG